MLISVVPSDGNVSVHASMLIYISAVRGLMHLHSVTKESVNGKSSGNH